MNLPQKYPKVNFYCKNTDGHTPLIPDFGFLGKVHGCNLRLVGAHVQINNGQAAMDQGHALMVVLMGIEPFTVRPAMTQGVARGLKTVRGGWPGADVACYCAHIVDGNLKFEI